MTPSMKMRFEQMAAVSRVAAQLETIKLNAATARKGFAGRVAEGWRGVRDEADRQLAALAPDRTIPEVGIVPPESELPLAQKEKAQ